MDALAVMGLFVAAFFARRNMLVHDGLFPDDGWQAFGAAKGSLSNLLTVGFSAPGFTGALMVWYRLVGAPERMVDLAFAAGVLTPAVLYVALRRFGYIWSISLLLGAALASEKLNIVYSGRVKPYVIDALIVLGITALVPRLVRVHFTWRVAALWIFGSFAVGSFSPFALVAAGVAGMIVLLRPAGDRVMRAVAVAGQGALSVALTLGVRRAYHPKALESWWKSNFDGFVGFDAQPLRLVSDIATHLRRVAVVFSGGPSWWVTLTLVAVLVALAVDALVRRRSSRALRAQYLLLLLLAAVAASVANALPLGPTSVGMRLSLWLVPIFAIGAASALDHLRTRFTTHQVTRIAFDVVAVVSAALLIVSASNVRPASQFVPSSSAVRYIERTLTDNDVVFVQHTEIMYSYATASYVRVVVRPTQKIVAFEPDFHDSRFHYLTFGGKLGDMLLLASASDVDRKNYVARVISAADRVFLYLQAFPEPPRRGPLAFARVLGRLGFTQEKDTRFGNARVIVWRRSTP